MSEYLRFDLKGFKKLDEALQGMSEDLQRKALQQANLAGAKVVLAAAKGTSAFKDVTGNLRKSLVVKMDTDVKKAGGFSYFVGANWKGFYGYFLEKGFMATGPRGTAGVETYKDRRGRTRTRRLSKRGAGLTRTEWRNQEKRNGATHVPASPFLRPALEDNIEAVTNKIRDRLAKRIDYYCNKYNKRPR